MSEENLDTASVESNTDTPAPSEPSYYLSEGVAGDGDAPEWFKSSKYKTVADQAKAYQGLESKLGSFTGAPESYDHNNPEGFELQPDDPMLESARSWAKEQNMSQEGFDSLVSLYAEMEAGKNKALDDAMQEQIAQIENFDSRSANINDFLKANDMESLSGMVTSKDQLEQLEKLLDMAGKAAIDPEGEASAVPSQEEIDKLMFEKDEFGRQIYNYDKERQAKVRKMIAAKVGNGDGRQMVGFG